MAFPEEIDGKNKNGTNLNALEAEKMAEVINKINKGYGKINKKKYSEGKCECECESAFDEMTACACECVSFFV